MKIRTFGKKKQCCAISINLFFLFSLLVGCGRQPVLSQPATNDWEKVIDIEDQSILVVDDLSGEIVVSDYGNENIFFLNPAGSEKIRRLQFPTKVGELCVFLNQIWVVDLSGSMFYNSGSGWILVPDWKYGLANGCLSDSRSQTLYFWSEHFAMFYMNGVWADLSLPTVDEIVDLKIDSLGDLFLMSKDGGLFRKKNTTEALWVKVSDITQPEVVKIFVPSDDDIWIATLSKLYLFSDSKNLTELLSIEKRTVSPVVQNIIFFHESYWIFLPEEIILYDKSEIKRLDPPYDAKYILDVGLDFGLEQIYILTDRGVYSYSEE